MNSFISYKLQPTLSSFFLFSSALCLLSLVGCSSQPPTPQRNLYAVTRYHDALTDFHEYRAPERETLSYTARQEFETASTVIDQTGDIEYQPVPSDEVDDGDIEITPELLKEPKIYPALSIIRPIMDNIRITSPFGVRMHPILHRKLMHAGVDIAGDRGDKVVASAGGKVINSGRNGSYGLTVDIQSGRGVVLRYAHLDKIKVKEGQLVQQGQVIGNVGGTGRVTAPHLHFEVRMNDRPINPMQFLAPHHQVASNNKHKHGRGNL